MKQHNDQYQNRRQIGKRPAENDQIHQRSGLVPVSPVLKKGLVWACVGTSGGIFLILSCVLLLMSLPPLSGRLTQTAPGNLPAATAGPPTTTSSPSILISPLVSSTLAQPTFTPPVLTPVVSPETTIASVPLTTPLTTTPDPLPSTPLLTHSLEISAPELEWLAVPASEFIKGSSDEELDAAMTECNATEGNCQIEWFLSEQPRQTIFVDAFEITKYEITNAQYQTCVTAGVCKPAGRKITDDNIPLRSIFFADEYPVVGVNWTDADIFCHWVNGRLPTEAEWEKAARGTDGRRYPWGNSYDPSMASLATSNPSAVGSFPAGASPYDVLDMAGNVFEWTATPAGENYVLRGGSWFKYYFRGRTTDRGTQLPSDFANYDIGFRCVR